MGGFIPPHTSKTNSTASLTNSYHILRREYYLFFALMPTPGFMKHSHAAVHYRLPRTKIVWSQIFPRWYCRHMFSHYAAKRSSTHINSSLTKFAIHTLHGAYISYPPLNPYRACLYYDCVLSPFRDKLRYFQELHYISLFRYYDPFDPFDPYKQITKSRFTTRARYACIRTKPVRN